ncbi:MAG: GMC family oxidoreductase N-terminal domain-containing protein, partial [Candidatus Binatia bacterium]
MESDRRYDVIIIGTGAGGGTLAWKLAPSGKRILVLERGPYVPREKRNWDVHDVVVGGAYHIKDAWLDARGKEFHAGTHYFVGGNTKFYGAALIRMRERDFGEVRHHGGLSPAWPVGYREMEPYYTQAEHLYQVHGERGVDPTEPAASAPYAHPALSHEPRMQELFDDLRGGGFRPFPMPVGLMLDEQNPRKSKCIRCETCDGFPCLVNAKADAQVICVDPALEHPNVTLLTDAKVTRLETSASGREVTTVHVEREGVAEAYSASIVVVSAGAINSAALLLQSASDAHPDGLANGSGVVGRHYMGHVNSVLLAISKAPNPTVFQKTLGINDFYFGGEDWPHPMGHISFIGNTNVIAGGAPSIAPKLSNDLIATHSLGYWMTSE